MTLNEIATAAQATSRAKGFVDDGPVNIDQKLLLTVGELVEAQNELREGRAPGYVYFSPKPEGFLIELADAVIRIAQLAEHVREQTGCISLGEAVAMKMAYNTTRPFKHGKKF